MNSFNEEVTSVWSFKERGEWATHKGDYPGNCSPYVVKNLLIKYKIFIKSMMNKNGKFLKPPFYAG